MALLLVSGGFSWILLRHGWTLRSPEALILTGGTALEANQVIEAAKLRGEGLRYLIFDEILPNALAPLLAEFGLRFCFVFLTIASLSFLGVGIQPPLADWGTMVRDLAQFINFAAFSPLTATLPLLAAGAIALLTVAVNFVVDWMLHKSSGLKE